MNIKNSKLINIPKGAMFWDEPLMKNLYTLESMINDLDLGGGANLGELQRQIDKVQNNLETLAVTHDVDIEEIHKLMKTLKQQVDDMDIESIHRLIDDINDNIVDINAQLSKIGTNIKQIDSALNQHTESIEDNYTLIESIQDDIALSNQAVSNIQQNMDSLEVRVSRLEDGSSSLPEEWVDKIEGHLAELKTWKDSTEILLTELNNGVNSLQEDVADISERLPELESIVSESNSLVNVLDQAVDDLTGIVTGHVSDIEYLKETVEELAIQVETLSNIELQIDFVVDAINDMNNLVTMVEGSLCYVRSTEELFIYDDKWKKITGGTAGSSTVDWDDIIGKPLSEVEGIDDAVSKAHNHSNKIALDRVTNSKIMQWDNKAEKDTVNAIDENVKGLKIDVDKISLLSSENKDEIVKMSELIEEMSKNMIYISEE